MKFARNHIGIGGEARRPMPAFTLVELLVVIAIIAILAGLLLTGSARSKARARAVQCTSNLHQWGLAYRMYANDNEDFLPRRGQGIQVLAEIDRPADWFNALPTYLGMPAFQDMVTNNVKPAAHSGSVFICPSADDPGGTYFLPYGMNMNLCPWNLAVATKYTDVAQPDSVVAMADAPGPYASTFPSARAYSIVARHSARINLLFLAGQAVSFSGAYVGCGTGDPKLAEVRWLTGTTSDATAGNY
ncbi:MAG TPA: type II secretion system protein [Verrucomicrobiae bacterium]|nr:type II secretion system protein [Verrucomicrobiae bacterium]